MRWKHPFMHGPDNGTSADSAEAVLEHVFGGLANVRPDLAAAEAAETDRKAAGKKIDDPIVEIGRPLLDSERTAAEEAENTEAKPDEAARETAPPAKPGEDDGSDHESPDDEQATLNALIAKYQGKPESMAKALLGLRSLQTKTAEEKKEIEAQADAIATVIDRDYDMVNGELVLKPDVAGRALRNGSGRPKPFAAPTEAEVRAQVEAEFKAQAADLFDEDQIPAYLAKIKPMIDKVTSERSTMARANAEAFKYNMLAEVGNVVREHLQAHPNDKDILSEIDAIYGGIPEEVRSAAVLDEWLPFGKVAELVRAKASIPNLVKEAYELGKKHRGEAGKITEGGAPGRSRPAPTRGTSSDVVSGLSKEGILRGSGLPSIDTLFAR